jgi:hypothetical protein
MTTTYQKARRVSWKLLPVGSRERAIARIAHIANVNTILGGASALVLVKRAYAMHLPSADDLADAVDATYSASTGRPSPEHSAHECGECGQIHLGESAALACCCDCDDPF